MKKFFKRMTENVKTNMQDAFTRNFTIMGLGFTTCCVVMCVAASFLK